MLTLTKATIECAHCGHGLAGSATYGLDIVRCTGEGGCGKFTKVETHAKTRKIVARATLDRSPAHHDDVVEV